MPQTETKSSAAYHGRLCGLGIDPDVTHSSGRSPCASVSGAVTARPAEEGKEVWDYVTVRKDAHMFWWLYYATNPCKNFSELPLVMWLQVKVAWLPGQVPPLTTLLALEDSQLSGEGLM